MGQTKGKYDYQVLWIEVVGLFIQHSGRAQSQPVQDPTFSPQPAKIKYITWFLLKENVGRELRTGSDPRQILEEELVCLLFYGITKETGKANLGEPV